MSSDQPLILLDSDVIRHFINGGHLDKLASVYPGRLVILDRVKHEICRSIGIRPVVENFLTNSNIPTVPFPNDMTIIREYAYLQRENFGIGESACMAVARYQNQFIASSNLRDIARYCQQHQITYFTTMDILEQALNDGILTHDQCDQFITDVLAVGSKLPFKTMTLYLASKA